MEDLEDLVQAIRELDPSYEVQLAYYDQIGHRVTFWEVVTVWLPTVSDNAALVLLISQAIAWANRRFKKEEEEQTQDLAEDEDSKPQTKYRPKSITILGPDGNVLKSIVVHAPNEEPEDKTVEEAKKPPRRRPPIR
jgi:hypothetical protein